MQWVLPLVNIYKPTLCYNSQDYSLNTILILLNSIHAYFITNYYEVYIFEIKYHETTISFVTLAGIGDFSTNSINLYNKLWNVCSIWGRGGSRSAHGVKTEWTFNFNLQMYWRDFYTGRIFDGYRSLLAQKKKNVWMNYIPVSKVLWCYELHISYSSTHFTTSYIP